MNNEKNREIESILALFKSEGLDAYDFEKCMKSLSETCLPTRLSETYRSKIYPVAKEAIDLGADFERLMKWRLSS